MSSRNAWKNWNKHTALNIQNSTFCDSLKQLCWQTQLLTSSAARCPQSNLSLSYWSQVKPSCWATAANPKLSWDLCTRTSAILWTNSVCLTEPVWMWPKPQLPGDDPSAPSLTPPRQSSSIPHPHWAAVPFFSPFAGTKRCQKALPAWSLTTNHSQTHKPGALHGCNSIATLQYCCPESHSLLPGWLFTFLGGIWKRQHLWASPAFSTISACLYFSKQTNQKAW